MYIYINIILLYRKIQFNRTNIKKNIATFKLINSSIGDNTEFVFVNLVLYIRKFYELHSDETKGIK